MFYLLLLLVVRFVEFLGSGGVKRVVTGPWVRRDSGPVRIRDYLLLFLGRCVEFLGSGGAKGLVTGPS